MQFYPLAPGPKELKVGASGFVIHPGSFPEKMLGSGLRGSSGLELSDRSKVELKRKPIEFTVEFGDSSIRPKEQKVPRATSMVTFKLENRGQKPHRLGARFFEAGSVALLEGKDLVLPPPVERFPTLALKPGTTFGIASDTSYDHFYLEIGPGGSAALTWDSEQHSGSKFPDQLEFFCGIEGHAETLRFVRADVTAASSVQAADPPAPSAAPSAVTSDRGLAGSSGLAAPAAASKGCGCRQAGGPDAGPLGATLLTALLALARFRRRSPISAA